MQNPTKTASSTLNHNIMINEANMALAIAECNSFVLPNYTKIAKKYGLIDTTLSRRHKGLTASYDESRSEHQRLLTNVQETLLIEHIKRLADRAILLTPRIIRNLVIELTKHDVGSKWVSRFEKRHAHELKGIYIRSIDHARQIADNSKHFQHYFDLLAEKIQKHHIKPANTYNFDEKGFLMGVCCAMKRIVPIEKLKSKKVLGSIQDGSRGFISLLACICADGSFLPPGLIYQGKSGDLQDTWLEDYDSSKDEAFFACSEKGWTNDDLGLSWLTKIFDPKTKPKAGNSKRLLLVDGHSSHINMRFVDYCDQNGIILAVLPPHSTHRLQPLDVGIFAPLARAYSNQIDQLIQSSQGFSSISKRTFWVLFQASWKTALTVANIFSAFAATGIHPLKPEKVLDRFTKKTPSPPISDNELTRKTPGSVRGLRRMEKVIRTQGELAAGMDMVFRASQKLATKVDLLEHENAGLREALIKEKGRRKRSKPMGLRGKDGAGQAVFYSPARIAAVRAEHERLRAEKEQEKQAKELKKQEQMLEKERKKQELQNRREERVKMRAEKEQQNELAKMAREAQKQLNEQLRLEQQKQKDLEKQKKQSTKRKREPDLPEELPERKTRIARNGRSITLPTRFRA